MPWPSRPARRCTAFPVDPIAETIAVPRNTLSGYLSIITRAGLVRARREGRPIFYREDFSRTGALLTAIVQECCDGHPEPCGNLADVIGRRFGYLNREKCVSATSDARELDFVFTVCDDAANEVCSVWPGQSVSGH